MRNSRSDGDRDRQPGGHSPERDQAQTGGCPRWKVEKKPLPGGLGYGDIGGDFMEDKVGSGS